MTISADNPLAEYAPVFPVLGFEIAANEPLTLVNDGFTLIVQDKREGEKYPVLLTIPGFTGAPHSKDVLLAILQIAVFGGQFDAQIQDGNIALNLVMGFSRPITPKEMLAVVVMGRTFTSACEEIVRNFGGEMCANS